MATIPRLAAESSLHASAHSPNRVPGLLLRLGFWCTGAMLAVIQTLGFRYYATADAVAYMDMSDGLMPGRSWHHLINGVWSPLYPALLGIARRVFHPAPGNEIYFDHLLNLPFFLFAFGCFEFLLHTILGSLPTDAEAGDKVGLPTWLYWTLGYTLFLWASLTEITLQSLRPDMLMAGFLYLALAIVVRMRKHAAN